MKTASDLQIDDMSIGDYITVTKGRMMEVSCSGKNVKLKEEIIFKGRVLKIVAIDLPYIIVDRYQVNYKDPTRKDIDVRTMVFKKLTSEYVSAFLGVDEEAEDTDPEID